MPWQEVSVIDARLRFVRDVQRGVFSVSELCRRHHISRPVEQVAHPIRAGWYDRARRSLPAAVVLSARDRSGPGRCALRAAPPAATLGRQKAPGQVAALATGLEAAPSGHRPCDSQTRRPYAGAAATDPATSSRSADEPDDRAQRRLDHRLQGAVQNPRWGLLLSLDGPGRSHALSPRLPGSPASVDRADPPRARAPLPRLRAARADPLR